MNKQSKSIKLPRTQDLEDKFPNQAQLQGQVSEVHENNYFRDFSIEDCRKRHINFIVLMTYVHKELDLPMEVTVEQFAHRVRDLIYAANRKTVEDLIENEKD